MDATTAANNQKRLTAVTDAGSVYFTNKKGYSMFRHVDLEATKAIEGNESLLVYGMTANTDEATGVVLNDANQVDAVASAKNGAKIIYKDTNTRQGQDGQRRSHGAKHQARSRGRFLQRVV